MADSSFSESRLVTADQFSYFVTDGALAPAGVLELLVRSGPDTKTTLQAHLCIDGPGTLEVFEGGTQDPRGTVVAALRRDRELLPPAEMTVWVGPTVIGPGDPLDKVATSGGSVSTLTWVLKKQKRYLFRVTNTGAGSANAVLTIDFSE